MTILKVKQKVDAITYCEGCIYEDNDECFGDDSIICWDDEGNEYIFIEVQDDNTDTN